MCKVSWSREVVSIAPTYNEIPRNEALEKARAEAVELAVAAGGIRETVEIIDAEDVPLQYSPGNTARVKINAAGDLA